MPDDFPGPLPTREVRIERYLPGRKIYLSWTTRRHFFQALDNIIVINLFFFFPTLGMMNRETTALILLWASLIIFCPQIKSLFKRRTFARILFCHWQQRLPNTLICVEEFTREVVFLWKEVGGDNILGEVFWAKVKNGISEGRLVLYSESKTLKTLDSTKFSNSDCIECSTIEGVIVWVISNWFEIISTITCWLVQHEIQLPDNLIIL